jgi:copper homeostasis protein
MFANLEICIDTADALALCEKAGVARLELCSALSVGGLTPSVGLMQLAAKSTVASRAMIRPRAGDFAFSQADTSQMLIDIDMARDCRLEGVVLGAIQQDATLDVTLLRSLCDRSGSLKKTLHRAVDLVPDPSRAIDIAVDLGFDCILTSGGSPRATDGVERLRRMVDHADGRISIMPGAGVNPTNVAQILSQTGATWVHSSCSAPQPKPTAASRRDALTNFGFSSGDERNTDANAIGDLLAAIKQAT